MIYHITSQQDWLAQSKAPQFTAKDLARDGFIHCCTQSQVDGVLERYFSGKKNLIILEIDESKLTAPVKYEPSANKELFPHVYGSINRSAITSVHRLESD